MVLVCEVFERVLYKKTLIELVDFHTQQPYRLSVVDNSNRIAMEKRGWKVFDKQVPAQSVVCETANDHHCLRTIGLGVYWRISVLKEMRYLAVVLAMAFFQT